MIELEYTTVPITKNVYIADVRNTTEYGAYIFGLNHFATNTIPTQTKNAKVAGTGVIVSGTWLFTLHVFVITHSLTQVSFCFA